MTSFSLEKKQLMLQNMLPKMDIHYNGTRKNVHFIRARDPIRSIPSSVVSTYYGLHAGRGGGLSAYFMYNQMEDLNKKRKTGQEPDGVTHFDVSVHKHPIRLLFVPFHHDPGYTEGMQEADWYKDVKFVFVSEAHAIYMQQHIGWIPANVVVLFPICYNDVIENGMMYTEVESFGILHSSETTYLPNSDKDLTLCPLFFGTEEEYNILLEEAKSTNQSQPSEEALYDQTTKKRIRVNED